MGGPFSSQMVHLGPGKVHKVHCGGVCATLFHIFPAISASGCQLLPHNAHYSLSLSLDLPCLCPGSPMFSTNDWVIASVLGSSPQSGDVLQIQYEVCGHSWQPSRSLQELMATTQEARKITATTQNPQQISSNHPEVPKKSPRSNIKHPEATRKYPAPPLSKLRPCWIPGTMGVAALPLGTRDNLHCDFLPVGYRG